MPPNPQARVLVSCPRCGHEQPESPKAFSTVCKKCGTHFHVQEALHPVARAAEVAVKSRQITCFDCGAELNAPASAESTMCRKCSRYIDLKDYRIASAVSKNFKTKGSFVIEPKGYVFNTEVIVADAVIKGRLLGKISAENSLTIFSTAEIKGTFTAARLIIPAENHFRWKEPIKVRSAEISGELAGNLLADGEVLFRSTARFFGDVKAKTVMVENGAVIVGYMNVGRVA